MIPLHRIRSCTRLIGQAVFALAVISATPAFAAGQADNWPDGPITFVSPFSAGGGGDTMTRLYATEFAKLMHTNFIVENISGAGGNIGTGRVARAAPDGNTIIFGTTGTMGTNLALYKTPGYSLDDFAPVALFEYTPLILVVSKDSPFHTVGDILAAAKQHPGSLTCASGGNGTASHLACGMLQEMSGVKFSHVPYRSSSSAYIDMMGGRVSFMIDVAPPLIPQIQQGGLRAVAVTMNKRLAALPGVPAIAETIPGYELISWDGLFAPKGTPPARLDKLHDMVSAALKDPAFIKLMDERGEILQEMPRQEFATFVRQEASRIGALVRKLGVTID